MNKVLSALFFICLVEPTAANAGQKDVVLIGSIAGTVFMHSGLPAPNFFVLIEGVYPPATLRTLLTTDEHGRYHADRLAPGEYVLYPYGEYPKFLIRHDMFFDATPSRVTISELEPKVLKDLVLPLETAMLYGQLTSHSGVPVGGSEILLCHADAVRRSARIAADGAGKFTYIIPSNERLSILVIAPSGEKMQQTDISFKPGETREIVLSVDKTSKVAGSACLRP